LLNWKQQMGSRGRKSSASLVVVAPLTKAVAPRIVAPAYLTPAELQVWRLTVDSLPAGHFGREQGPLLEGYVAHVAEARRVRALLRDTDPAAEGYRELLRLAGDEDRRALAAARGLRLTNQSRIHPATAGGRATAEPGLVDEVDAVRRCVAAAKKERK
jgi:hypothetical protein